MIRLLRVDESLSAHSTPGAYIKLKGQAIRIVGLHHHAFVFDIMAVPSCSLELIGSQKSE
jgi:hypothetical protein